MTTELPLTVTPTATPMPDAEREKLLAAPAFGRVFTDHMVSAAWDAEHGWHKAELTARQPLELDPAAKVLHYGQAIFEGLKAYLHPDGSVGLFRPEANAARLQRSARRMAMPELPEQLFLDTVKALVRQDRAWIPTKPEHSLYLRPFMFATEPGLGVQHPAARYQYLVIASPAGAYFPRGVEPVSVWLSTEYTRAAPGGTGEAKFAGNYAASFLAQRQALEAGCDQVVWLDACGHQYVEEMGGMNLVFVFGEGANARLVTPKLTGTLLPGITRDSLLRLAPDLGLGVEERLVSVAEWREGCAEGTISEVFACGTAAVITPVGSVRSNEGEWQVRDGAAGPLTMQLRERMLAIQYGQIPDPYGWIHQVE